MEFVRIETKHTAQLAKLHIQGIKTGFISSLGEDFVTELYKAVADSKCSFGFVAVEDGKVCGFAAFSTNLNSLYKFTLRQKGFKFAFLIIHKVLSLKIIKRAFETLIYPLRIKKMKLPFSTVLLSIAVDTESRGKGLGKKLLQMGFEECRKRGVESVRVLVGADNKPANNLYQNCGFKLLKQIYNHGVLSNLLLAPMAESRNAGPISDSCCENLYGRFLKESGVYVLTIDGVDWFDYSGFMMPAYFPHCCPPITNKLAKEVVRVSGRLFARWDSEFGQVRNSQWWYILKRGPWNIDQIADKKKRWMIRQGRKNFSVRKLSFDEVLLNCPEIAKLAASRYKGAREGIETSEILQQRINAATKVQGVLEYIGCFYQDKLVSFSENYIQDNAVFLNSIRHDPSFLDKYSSYGLLDGILEYYLNQMHFHYVLDGCRSIYHKTQFQEHLIKVFGFSYEYALLNIIYSKYFEAFLHITYPLRNLIWVVDDKRHCKGVDKIAAVLRQESIWRSCLDVKPAKYNKT